jgi:hypothetical protein
MVEADVVLGVVEEGGGEGSAEPPSEARTGHPKLWRWAWTWARAGELDGKELAGPVKPSGMPKDGRSLIRRVRESRRGKRQWRLASENKGGKGRGFYHRGRRGHRNGKRRKSNDLVFGRFAWNKKPRRAVFHPAACTRALIRPSERNHEERKDRRAFDRPQPRRH